MKIAGIILAAGASTRMGSNKMRLELGGEPIVRRAARRALAAGLSPVVIVLGNEPDLVRVDLAGLPIEFAYNSDFTGPTSSSLHRGLEALSTDVDAAVLLLGDMVSITEEMLRSVAAASEGSDAPLVVSRYGEVTAPPLLFRRSLFQELLDWSGEGCGKAIVKRHFSEAEVLDWPLQALGDVDTPDDLAAARAAEAAS